jgi:predicted nuclease of predicted toxin-antitoxin system
MTSLPHPVLPPLLADENFPRPCLDLLRAAGCDVIAIPSGTPPIQDTEVVNLARRGGRLLLTYDRDFGELIFRFGHPAPPGVIFVRLPPEPPERLAQRLLDLLTDPRAAVATNFSIVEEHRVRRRLLPSADRSVR